MQISRTKLYGMVWEKPIVRLAEEFGLSDVGLAKICRKHDIPLPERGYWARVASGKKVPKKALPRPENDETIEIHVHAPVSQEEKRSEKERRQEKQVRIELLGVIEVPQVLESPHKLTQKTRKYFEGVAKKVARWEKVKSFSHANWDDMPPMAEHGRYSCRPPNGFHLTASLDKVDWALRFLDTLAKTLEYSGFQIRADSQDRKGRVVVSAFKDGEETSFSLAEGYKRIALPPEIVKARRKEFKYASDHETKPSGSFNFAVSGKEFYTEKKWSAVPQKLEGHLPVIIAEFLEMVPRQKQIRIERAKEKEEYQERQRLAWEAERKRESQEAQFRGVLAEIHKLGELERLEAYLRRLEALYCEANGKLDGGVASWFKLIRDMALAQNPITTRLQSLQNLKNMDPSEIDWVPDEWRS